MQVLEQNRPLRICPSCGKEGYFYAQLGGNHDHRHRYTYTVHSNESPIGYYANGRLKYRRCQGGRLYNSIEEAEAAERQKEKKVRTKLHLFLKVTCPKCGEKGKLYKYPDREKGIDRYRVMHKNKRCYLQEKHKNKLGMNDLICPKCQKKGRVQNYTCLGVPHQVVIHERIVGEFWGKDQKFPKRKRCFLGRVK